MAPNILLGTIQISWCHARSPADKPPISAYDFANKNLWPSHRVDWVTAISKQGIELHIEAININAESFR